MILKCPHHGFETWRLVQYFYNGLTQTNRNMIESMNGGGFLSLVDDEAYKFLENFSESSQQWDFSNCKERSAPAIKKGGLYEVSEDLKFWSFSGCRLFRIGFWFDFFIEFWSLIGYA